MSEEIRRVDEGTLLYAPSDAVREHSRIRRYMDWLARQGRPRFDDYSELWRWSVTEVEAFWASIWDYFEVRAERPYRSVLSSRRMPGARWFEGAELSYAEHALRRRDDHLAVIHRSEDGARSTMTYAELCDQVARARAGLRRLGVTRGDRVAAFAPNCPETLVVFLATASLGAIWSSCSPEFGVGSVLDRFKQIEPKVLFAVDGYVYGGKRFDRRAALDEVRRGLSSLEHTVLLSRLDETVVGALPYPELLAHAAAPAFEAVPFEHPLWILYSSGTTGLPKPIVQGHGGILLEHYKVLSLHCDLGEADRFFWFTTTGWMMWNFLVSGLLVGSTLVLYEGHPGHPDMTALWRMAADEGITYFGTSAPYLMGCRKAGIDPEGEVDLSALRAVGSTGAPLPAEGFGWVYDHVGRDVLLGSVSGGTDVCTAFVASCPLLPVYAGELQCRALGAKVEAFSADGSPVEGELGELVLTEPMPSMPLFFWNDPDGRRLRESYYGHFPGVWRHGDWIKITPRGTSVIYGRSDSTLNRGGVRMGTSEFYRVIEAMDAVEDSVVVDTGTLDTEGKLYLFVVLAEGRTLDEPLSQQIRQTLRAQLSPRHVPDAIFAIREVPRTLSGKKLEVPLKKILGGVPMEQAVNRGTLKNPDAIDDVLGQVRHATK